MTARRVLVTQERIVQIDDDNELKCGERCQFLSEGTKAFAYCTLSGGLCKVIDRNRTEACTGGDKLAQEPK